MIQSGGSPTYGFKLLELAGDMAAVAEIRTCKHCVRDYLLSPLHRYSHDVPRER